MSTLDLSKLSNVKQLGGGAIQCACPQCRQNGGDKTGNHLKIWPGGAFNCIVAGKDKTHNKAIRAYLKGILGSTDDIEFIEPSPRLMVEPVYPEEMLSKLIKDHSYWLKRGAKPEIMEMLEGGVAPIDEKSKLSNRYCIPIRGLTGKINGFSGRILGDDTYAVKYKHLVKSSSVAWPWHLSGPSIIQTKKAVLQEGWSEWIALAGSGIMNSLSLLGLNLNSVIIGKLIESDVKTVVISTNGGDDESKLKKGRRKALDMKERLDQFFNPENVIIHHPKSDWGDATEEERQEFKKWLEAL